MAYDHSKKIGNQGDLLKHSILHNSVLHILNQTAPEGLFVYAESHCGRASYISPDEKGSEWKNGIGLLSSTTKEDRASCPGIESYFDATLSSKMKMGQQNYGSSAIAFRCCRVLNRGFRFELYETNIHACDDLTRFYSPWLEEGIRIHNVDGYDGIKKLDSASLLLVDPPSLDSTSIVACIAHLRKQLIPYICWTPRSSSSNGNKAESQTSQDFGKLTCVGKHISARWANPSGAAQHTFGCRLTVSEDLSDIAEQTASQLTSLLKSHQWALY